MWAKAVEGARGTGTIHDKGEEEEENFGVVERFQEFDRRQFL